MNSRVLLVVVALLAYCEIVRAIEKPCSYCKFCNECKHCETNCPCPTPDFAPNCNMCKYCQYCTLCKLCDTFCADEGYMASITSSFSDFFSSASAFAKNSLGIEVAPSLIEEVDQSLLERELKKVRQGQFVTGESRVEDLAEEDLRLFLRTHPMAYVVYYAPWCGHSKSFRYPYKKAADEAPDVGFGAVDCTWHEDFCVKQGVTSFPTVKLYKNSEFFRTFNQYRTTDYLLKFLEDPDMPAPEQSPPPPPPPPADPTPFYRDTDGEVVMLREDTYKEHVENARETVVMFYAPWCPHCSKIKPAYMEAAEQAKPGVFAALDCTVDQEVCRGEGVRGFPTLKVFRHGVGEVFSGARTTEGFLGAVSKKSLKKGKKNAAKGEL